MAKCRYCGTNIDSAMAYSVTKGQYYCNKECYDNKQRIKLNEGKSTKIRYKPIEGTDRREFTDTIQNLFVQAGWNKNKINWSMLMSQASNILKQHEKWSYATLTYILWYMTEILELQLITKESNYSPLSLVEYYGQEAEEYFNQTQRIEQNIEKFDFNENKIVIKNNFTYNKNKHKEIDISNI